MTKILAIIPARGGSKGIPNKNIADLAGKPLIGWTIANAKSSLSIDRVIVTTDSQAIANVASYYDAEVPFLRPAELAQDNTLGIQPVLHLLDWLEQQENYLPDYVMVLQPTSPLRTTNDMEAAISLAIEYQADSVVSVSPTEQHPYWMKTITEEGYLQDFVLSKDKGDRRQELPSVYALNGAIYLARREIVIEKNSFYSDRTYSYIMPVERSLDIDTPWDLYLANLILKDKTQSFLDQHPVLEAQV